MKQALARGRESLLLRPIGPGIVLSLALGLPLTETAGGAVRRVPEDFVTIQSAIDASAVGDTVLVAPGIYRGVGNRDIEFHGRDLVLISRDGPEHTVIDCEAAGRGFNIQEWETQAARIEGLTITNGTAVQGAGIHCALSSPTIVRCHFHRNQASQVGGGIFLICSEALVQECVISQNLSGSKGGGLATECGAPVIEDCVITGNWGYRGGGVCFSGIGTHYMRNCTIAGNLGSYGGGIRAYTPFLLERCIVWGNCVFIDGAEVDGVGEFRCSVVDSTGVSDPVVYDEDCRFIDPEFCAPHPCGYASGGDWSLRARSVCLAENSPCGEQIGALGWGCGALPGEGACCFPDGTCRILSSEQCALEQGVYLGDESACVPNPCSATPVEATTWGRLKSLYR